MSKRGKNVKKWKPGTLEILDVSDLFSTEKVEALAEYLPHIRDLVEFRNGVLSAAGWYKLSLNSDARPKGSEKRDLLETLQTTISNLEDALDSLDYDSRKAIERAASDDVSDGDHSPWINLEPPGLPNTGPSRVRHARWLLEQLSRWTKTTHGKTDKSPRGRTPHDAEREAVKLLKNLWADQAGKSATLITDSNSGKKYGPFLDFCRGVLWPVSDLIGREQSDLTKVIQEVLYSKTKN